MSTLSSKKSLLILLPYVGEEYWYFKNFGISALGHICADLREHGIPYEIVNPNESNGSAFKELEQKLVLLTRRLSDKQNILREYLRSANDSRLRKIFEGSLATNLFKSVPSHILYFQPYYKSHVYTYLAFLNQFKSEHKEVQLLCHGSFFWDKSPAFLQEHPYLDLVLGYHCRNEVRLIVQGHNNEQVTNISYRHKGKGIKRLAGSSIESMRKYPDYFSVLANVEIAAVEYIRGCPFNCFFCEYKPNHPEFIRKNPSILSQEIEYNLKRGVRGIWFDAPAINLDEEKLIEFCKMLIKNKLTRSWSAPAIPFSLQRSTYRLMAQAGCVQLRWGIETADSIMISKFNKGISQESIINSLKDSRNSGINNSLTFMVGLPGEQSENQRQKMKFIIKHKDIIQSVKIYAFEVRRNTPIFNHPKDFQLKLQRDQLDERFIRYDLIEGLGWESLQERNQLFIDEFSNFLRLQKIPHESPEKYFLSILEGKSS